MSKTIGILGGMGPLATVDFVEKIIEVYIGVTVIASLLHVMIVSLFG